MITQTPTIMVVGNDPVLCTVLQRILETSNYRVITASDCASTLELIKKNRPALVIVDAFLSRCQQRELIACLNEIEGCRVIFFTNGSSLASMKNLKGLSGQTDAFISRPTSIKKLLSITENTLAGNKNRVGVGA
ncbi:MAG: response regulator [Dehalococcoidales bacterium]|nr:response regulator [Dehalococcoidales bacterium]